MKRTIIIYGIALAALTGLLKFIEYQFWVKALRLEFYIGLVAVFFTGLGVWMGLKLTKPRPKTMESELIPASSHEIAKPILPTNSGISKREIEVLQLMSEGLSNQEIADRLFVSLNTVKTHSSNLFMKLDAKRRTQAIQKAKEIGLIQ